MPAPRRPLELGQCATPVPVSPKRAISSAFRWTQCASQTSSPSQPRSSRYCTGRTPKRSTQKTSSSSVSARWVCRRTPRRRASCAVSAISSGVTEKGEHGASAMRTMAPGAGSWKRSMAASLAARIASRSSTTSSGGRPPSDCPRSMDPRHGWKRTPRPRAASISTSSRSPAPAREDVVVVGRGRAARARERRQPGARGGRLHLVVDVGPHRIELDEPLEERRLLREPARGPLVEVVVAVDEARRGETAAAVDASACALRRRSLAEGDDAIVLDDQVAVAVLGAGGVDRGDRAALDDRPHASLPAASRTASRIFS